jgi:putative transposase
MIKEGHEISIIRQTEMVGISRSSYYYTPVAISEHDLELMKRIDEIHLKYPFYGSRRIRLELYDSWSYHVGRDHVRTLMKKMDIHALYQKPRLSDKHPGHTIFPYLLRGLDITLPNHVWATDITYIPMAKGFCYLVAIIDWASRKVLAWRISNTLDVSFCIEALEEAIRNFGAPAIFNTDQGSQFTSDAFTAALKANSIEISMDGRGRWMDNVFIERVWRSLKYEEVYLKAYESVSAARKGIGAYFSFYNEKRRHQGLDDQTPDVVYYTPSQTGKAA